MGENKLREWCESGVSNLFLKLKYQELYTSRLSLQPFLQHVVDGFPELGDGGDDLPAPEIALTPFKGPLNQVEPKLFRLHLTHLNKYRN